MLLLGCLIFCSCQGSQGIQGEAGVNGKTPVFRENSGWLEWKYEDDDDSEWRQIYQLDKPAETEFTYVINADGESYAIVGISNFTSTVVEIPSEYNGKPVTKISSVKPLNYSGVKEVIIPDSITEIEKQAFLNCSALEKITIPESVTTVGAEAFYMCSSLKEVYINIESIEPMTFYHCDNLEKVTFGPKTKIIGDQAFAQCANLTEISFNNGLREIGSGAFNECSKLTSEIVIPKTVYKIGSCAFKNTAASKITFADHENWIYHFDGSPGISPFVQCGKLDLSDSIANVEFANSQTGCMYTWQKGIAVGVSGNIEPFAIVTGNNFAGYKFSGFDIDLISKIDEELEDYIFGFVYIENFDESFKGIDNGAYDIIISAMEYTSARAEKYSVSSVYYTNTESNYVIYGDKANSALMQKINETLLKIMNSDIYTTLKTKYDLK